MKLGCSTRLLLIIGVPLLVLTLGGLVIGGVGSALMGREPFAGAPRPEVPAEVIAHLGAIPVTNTMITAWLTTIVLVVLFWVATRRTRLVPKGLQNLMEWAVEMLLNFVEGVVGKEKGRVLFPVIATIFLFVFVNAWMGLIPGYSSIVLKESHEGETVLVPLLRPANTDLNVTLALALVSFVFVEYLGIRYRGFFRYVRKFINLGPLLNGLRQLFTGKLRAGLGGTMMGVVEAFVGIIEFLGEVIRIVSFTFRLFGNMTAGEVLLLLMFFLVPFVVPIIFYGLEMLVGFIQALIFGGLTLAFAAVATAESEHH